MSEAPDRLGRIIQWISAVLAAAASLYLIFVPTYTQVMVGNAGQEQVDYATLMDVNGTWVVVLVAIPVLLTLIPALIRGRIARLVSIVCAVLLTVTVVLGGFSIGLFFAPAWLAALIALFIPRSRSNRDDSNPS